MAAFDRPRRRRLTPDQVREIRRRAVTEPYGRVGRTFGISAGMVGMVYHRHLYQDVDPPNGEAVLVPEPEVKLQVEPRSTVRIGNLVKLLSGSPSLVVEAIKEESAQVTWWSGTALQSAWISVEVLEVVR